MVDRSDSASATTVLYVVVVVVAVLIATVLAPVVWNATRGSGGEERPSVAVLTLRGGTSDANVNAIAKDLRQARNNESIKAVVLRIDSPGGAVDSSERFYLAMNRTAAQMPVVSYVEGTAASGGYYGITPSDTIFVGPSSTVGSIGVIVQAPLSTVETEQHIRQSYVRSGPDKAMITKDSIRNEIESLQNSFVGTVMRHRGDELELSATEVSNADTYLGARAVQNGFADRIGSLDSAIQRAAELAKGIDGENYDVAYKKQPRTTSGIILTQDNVERVNGSFVYVEQSEEGTDFVPPVKYYAVWGIPEDNLPDDTEGVTANGSE